MKSWESRLPHQLVHVHNRRPQLPLAGPPEIICLFTLNAGSYGFLRKNEFIGQSHSPILFFFYRMKFSDLKF